LLGVTCDSGWHYHNGYCFYPSSAKATQFNARYECLAMDAELASISNKEEMDFVIVIS